MQIGFAEPAHGHRLTRAHCGMDAPVMHAGLLPGHPDDYHLARCFIAGCCNTDRRERAVGVLALLITCHDNYRPGWCTCAHLRFDPKILRPSHRCINAAAPKSRCEFGLDNAGDAEEFVVAAQRIKA